MEAFFSVEVLKNAVAFTITVVAGLLMLFFFFNNNNWPKQ